MKDSEAPEVPEAIRKIADSTDRKLAWQFFVFFSRFEYALKRDKRYLMPGTGDAQPNWDRFASDHNQQFSQLDSQRLASAVAFFQTSPPRKQKRENGRLGWSDPVAQGSTPLLIWLLLCIRTVRNNLFHGGKFPHLPVSDPSRDRELIENSVVVLSQSLKLDWQIERIFNEAIEM